MDRYRYDGGGPGGSGGGDLRKWRSPIGLVDISSDLSEEDYDGEEQLIDSPGTIAYLNLIQHQKQKKHQQVSNSNANSKGKTNAIASGGGGPSSSVNVNRDGTYTGGTLMDLDRDELEVEVPVSDETDSESEDEWANPVIFFDDDGIAVAQSPPPAPVATVFRSPKNPVNLVDGTGAGCASTSMAVARSPNDDRSQLIRRAVALTPVQEPTGQGQVKAYFPHDDQQPSCSSERENRISGQQQNFDQEEEVEEDIYYSDSSCTSSNKMLMEDNSLSFQRHHRIITTEIDDDININFNVDDKRQSRSSCPQKTPLGFSRTIFNSTDRDGNSTSRRRVDEKGIMDNLVRLKSFMFKVGRFLASAIGDGEAGNISITFTSSVMNIKVDTQHFYNKIKKTRGALFSLTIPTSSILFLKVNPNPDIKYRNTFFMSVTDDVSQDIRNKLRIDSSLFDPHCSFDNSVKYIKFRTTRHTNREEDLETLRKIFGQRMDIIDSETAEMLYGGNDNNNSRTVKRLNERLRSRSYLHSPDGPPRSRRQHSHSRSGSRSRSLNSNNNRSRSRSRSRTRNRSSRSYRRGLNRSGINIYESDSELSSSDNDNESAILQRIQANQIKPICKRNSFAKLNCYLMKIGTYLISGIGTTFDPANFNSEKGEIEFMFTNSTIAINVDTPHFLNTVTNIKGARFSFDIPSSSVLALKVYANHRGNSSFFLEFSAEQIKSIRSRFSILPHQFTCNRNSKDRSIKNKYLKFCTTRHTTLKSDIANLKNIYGSRLELITYETSEYYHGRGEKPNDLDDQEPIEPYFEPTDGVLVKMHCFFLKIGNYMASALGRTTNETFKPQIGSIEFNFNKDYINIKVDTPNFIAEVDGSKGVYFSVEIPTKSVVSIMVDGKIRKSIFLIKFNSLACENIRRQFGLSLGHFDCEASFKNVRIKYFKFGCTRHNTVEEDVLQLREIFGERLILIDSQLARYCLGLERMPSRICEDLERKERDFLLHLAGTRQSFTRRSRSRSISPKRKRPKNQEGRSISPPPPPLLSLVVKINCYVIKIGSFMAAAIGRTDQRIFSPERGSIDVSFSVDSIRIIADTPNFELNNNKGLYFSMDIRTNAVVSLLIDGNVKKSSFFIKFNEEATRKIREQFGLNIKQFDSESDSDVKYFKFSTTRHPSVSEDLENLKKIFGHKMQIIDSENAEMLYFGRKKAYLTLMREDDDQEGQRSISINRRVSLSKNRSKSPTSTSKALRGKAPLRCRSESPQSKEKIRRRVVTNNIRSKSPQAKAKAKEGTFHLAKVKIERKSRSKSPRKVISSSSVGTTVTVKSSPSQSQSLRENNLEAFFTFKLKCIHFGRFTFKEESSVVIRPSSKAVILSMMHIGSGNQNQPVNFRILHQDAVQIYIAQFKSNGLNRHVNGENLMLFFNMKNGKFVDELANKLGRGIFEKFKPKSNDIAQKYVILLLEIVSDFDLARKITIIKAVFGDTCQELSSEDSLVQQLKQVILKNSSASK